MRDLERESDVGILMFFKRSKGPKADVTFTFAFFQCVWTPTEEQNQLEPLVSKMKYSPFLQNYLIQTPSICMHSSLSILADGAQMELSTPQIWTATIAGTYCVTSRQPAKSASDSTPIYSDVYTKFFILNEIEFSNFFIFNALLFIFSDSFLMFTFRNSRRSCAVVFVYLPLSPKFYAPWTSGTGSPSLFHQTKITVGLSVKTSLRLPVSLFQSHLFCCQLCFN